MGTGTWALAQAVSLALILKTDSHWISSADKCPRWTDCVWTPVCQYIFALQSSKSKSENSTSEEVWEGDGHGEVLWVAVQVDEVGGEQEAGGGHGEAGREHDGEGEAGLLAEPRPGLVDEHEVGGGEEAEHAEHVAVRIRWDLLQQVTCIIKRYVLFIFVQSIAIYFESR